MLCKSGRVSAYPSFPRLRHHSNPQAGSNSSRYKLVRREPLGSPFAPPQKPACPDASFESSADKHAASRNQVMFEELCNAHSHLSSSLQEISQGRHAEELRSRLLAKVSDTTAGRYLAFFALARSSDEGPLAHSQNVMKALRWYKKLGVTAI